MKNLLIFILALIILPTFSCNTTSKADAKKGADLILEGKIVHNKSNPYSLNTDFVFNTDAHISVSITFVEMMDAPSKIIWEKDYTDVKELPFSFKIHGNEKTFSEKKEWGAIK